MDWDDLILVGIVARTHGIKGQVIVNPETDFIDDRFRPGAVFETRMPGGARGRLEVESARVHHGRPIIAVTGVTSMNDAEQLAGCELRIQPDAQVALPEGVYYHHQLVGCEVVRASGELVGTVTKVERGLGQSRLVVVGGAREMQIPLVDAFCQVDIEHRRIVVTPPEGLLEL